MKNLFEDPQFDETLNEINSDFLWRKSKKQALKDRIMKDIEVVDRMEREINPLEITRLKGSFGRKVAYACASIAVLFGLFIGSTFISPVMAEVAAKIPYLNKVFQSKPINQVLWDELHEKGYKISSLGGDARNIWITIEGSDEYYQDVRGEVKSIVEGILKSRDYDAYKVVVTRPIESDPEPISEREQLLEKTLVEIQEELEKQDFTILSRGYGYSSPNSKEIIVQFDVPSTEKRDDVIKEIINKKLKSVNNDTYKININKIDFVQREREGKWQKIFPAIIEGLTAKKEYQVTGFAYSFHPAPLQIIIKTSIKSTDKDAAERVTLIEKTIEEFLHSKEIKSKIEGEEYKIIIRGKDNKQIN